MTPEIAVIDFKWHLSSFSMANSVYMVPYKNPNNAGSAA
jgi:hypothetical protein